MPDGAAARVVEASGVQANVVQAGADSEVKVAVDAAVVARRRLR